MMTTSTKLFVLLGFVAGCQAEAPLHIQLVHSATQGYGVQPAGEDKGTLYAFVRVDAPRDTTLALASAELRRGGTACAHTIAAPVVSRVTPDDSSTRGLTLARLATGTPFDGKLDKGATYLRIVADLDHMCVGDGEPTLALHFDNAVDVTQVIVESMPT